MLGSGEASGKECVKNCVQNVKLRICWETCELKIMCSRLHHSPGTHLAELCLCAHSPGQPVLVLHVLPSFPQMCSVWYSSSFQSNKIEYSIHWWEIRPCSSLSQWSEFMGCSWKSLKTVCTKLYVSCMLSSPVWETKRGVWGGNVLWIFGNLINNKTLDFLILHSEQFVLTQVS